MKSINGKHQILEDRLFERLSQKHYIDNVQQNIEYNRGEFDVLVFCDNHVVYYEIKSNDTIKARVKAGKQLRRGTKYLKQMYGMDAYGVYFTPTKIQIYAKNGKRH